jgi:benzoyl-CoA 2,3-dioxygenase component B
VVDGQLVTEAVPALRAINCRLLDDYIADCQGGIDRWNKVIEKAGIDFRSRSRTRASTAASASSPATA